MSKFVDFFSDKQVQDVMEAFLTRFPGMFGGFDTSKIGFVTTKKKKAKEVIKLHRVRYPFSVWFTKVYVAECSEALWQKLDPTKRNLAVFKAMCSIPNDGFDEQSKQYGKLLQPDIKMFMREYAASGGIPNWMENPAARNPLEEEVEAKGSKKRRPVTDADIESVGQENSLAEAVGQ